MSALFAYIVRSWECRLPTIMRSRLLDVCTLVCSLFICAVLDFSHLFLVSFPLTLSLHLLFMRSKSILALSLFLILPRCCACLLASAGLSLNSGLFPLSNLLWSDWKIMQGRISFLIVIVVLRVPVTIRRLFEKQFVLNDISQNHLECRGALFFVSFCVPFCAF